jgi:prophage regulatory protein
MSERKTPITPPEAQHVRVADVDAVNWAAEVRRLIRLPDVKSMTGLSRSEIYRLESISKFPKRVPVGARTTCWDWGEIQLWIQARIEAREEATKQRHEVGQRLARSRRASMAAA